MDDIIYGHKAAPCIKCKSKKKHCLCLKNGDPVSEALLEPILVATLYCKVYISYWVQLITECNLLDSAMGHTHKFSLIFMGMA